MHNTWYMIHDILLNIYTNNLFADVDARSMTPSRNTRSCILRSIPLSPGRSFLLKFCQLAFQWWKQLAFLTTGKLENISNDMIYMIYNWSFHLIVSLVSFYICTCLISTMNDNMDKKLREKIILDKKLTRIWNTLENFQQSSSKQK